MYAFCPLLGTWKHFCKRCNVNNREDQTTRDYRTIVKAKATLMLLLLLLVLLLLLMLLLVLLLVMLLV